MSPFTQCLSPALTVRSLVRGGQTSTQMRVVPHSTRPQSSPPPFCARLLRLNTGTQNASAAHIVLSRQRETLIGEHCGAAWLQNGWLVLDAKEGKIWLLWLLSEFKARGSVRFVVVHCHERRRDIVIANCAKPVNNEAQPSVGIFRPQIGGNARCVSRSFGTLCHEGDKMQRVQKATKIPRRTAK